MCKKSKKWLYLILRDNQNHILKFICVFILLTVFMILQGCGNPRQAVPINLLDGKTVDHITKIRVTAIPLLDVRVTSPEDIESIANYFNSLNPAETEKDAENYAGMRHIIEFFFDDDTTNRIKLISNRFIIVDDHPAQKLPYEEASHFDVVIGNIFLTQFRAENAEKRNIITGEILSVLYEESGRDIKCELKTDENEIKEVNVQSAKIFDITGSGHLRLYAGDKAEFYFGDNDYIAYTIFITQSGIP